MKAVIFSLIMAFSASSFAVESPDFLKQFQKSKFEIVDTLFKNYGKGEGFVPNVGVKAKLSNGVTRTHFVSIMNACVTGEKVQTISPVKSCLSYEYPQKECQAVKEFRDRWPRRPLPPRLAKRVCYDKTKQKVCEAFETVMASAPIHTVKNRCAQKYEQVYKDWVRALKKKYWNDKDEYEKQLRAYKDEYPNCTLFSTYPSVKRTSYNFDIVENIKKYDRHDEDELNDEYDSRVKEKLIMNVDVELPQCL